MFDKKNFPKKSENFSDWYLTLVQNAELVDYGPVKGTIIFRPYGYAIWENIQREMDIEIKEQGISNAYFPLFIPESFLKREKEHVEGFSPELAIVTYAGGEELTEKIVVRPTSETIMYDSYSKWVQSWRDLPILINQWNNVVRWEKRTFPFIRTSEFLWQEGHTAHATHEESLSYVDWAIKMYEKIYREFLALPGFIGRKSESEKFAGAVMTLTYETLMPDGKALQSCTSHDLGQNFAKAFDISFQDKNGENQFAWQTSWGFSTRSIGGLIMTHGDDNGLKLPPRVAPVQVIILCAKKPKNTDEENSALDEYAQEVLKKLKAINIRVQIDNRNDESLGFKINKWEQKGVPIRLEIGQNEIAANSVTLVRRDTFEKISVDQDSLTEKVKTTIDEIHDGLYSSALKFLNENTHVVDSYDEFKQILETKKGFLRAFWCEDADCEKKIKEETKASTRCLPSDAPEENGKCIFCGKDAKYRWIFAQSY